MLRTICGGDYFKSQTHLFCNYNKTLHLCFQFGGGSAAQQVTTASALSPSHKSTNKHQRTCSLISNFISFLPTADVILDPMTNHPWLLLSDDQRKVQESSVVSEQPQSSQRFDEWPCVLGREGFSSGRHYWEVNIANNGYWRVGVTTADSERHGKFTMMPKKGYWVLWRSTHKFYACSKPEKELPLSLVPRRMGVYLDYEEGQISFYNAETKSHIYTFTGTFREKLYPLFAPLDGRTLMTVIPPNNISGK